MTSPAETARPRRLTFTVAIDEADPLQKHLLDLLDGMGAAVRGRWVKRHLLMGFALGARLSSEEADRLLNTSISTKTV